MRKLRLELDELAVESFATQAAPREGPGTVRGHDLTTNRTDPVPIDRKTLESVVTCPVDVCRIETVYTCPTGCPTCGATLCDWTCIGDDTCVTLCGSTCPSDPVACCI